MSDASRKVRSIVFNHDGKRVEATIGEFMRVRRYIYKRRRVEGLGRDERTGVGGRVVDIRPGQPYFVFLDPATETREWANPFMVGQDDLVEVVYSDESM